jgi:4-amino-4-deoxy-L-arabinose transferase
VLFKTHFTPSDLSFLFAGSFLVLLSIFLFYRGQIRSALFLLFLGGFTFRLLITLIDPFVYSWDEQFHALVARNMMQFPFRPMLYRDPALPFDYRNWTGNGVWLHKPPLFLWQMALSMKCFGISVFSVRLPSAILSALCIPALYRIGKIVADEVRGYLAALLLAISYLHINTVSGIISTDQNDVVFMAYVLFSIWCWVEYENSGKKIWLIFAGLFSGCAVLVKWLIGLLVYAGWGTVTLCQAEKRRNRQSWYDMGLSALITVAVALPWQIYIHFQFPHESAYETAENIKTLTDSFGHTGKWWFHFFMLRENYTFLFLFLLVPGLFLFVRSKVKPAFQLAILVNVCLVYLFFSFVQTRMPLFCFIVSPLLLLICAFTLDRCFQWIKKILPGFSKWIAALSLLVTSFFFLDIDRFEREHTNREKDNYYRLFHLRQIERARAISGLLQSEGKHSVVFNCGLYNAATFMFYTGITAYDNFPSAEEVDVLIQKGWHIAVFEEKNLPDYLKDNQAIQKIAGNF